MKEKIDVYQIITDRIIAMLEEGKIPWQKPWKSDANAPKNLVSKKPYRGLNVFVLAASRYGSPYWVTFKQAAALGGTVKKGEKATPVLFWNWREVDDADSVTGKKRIPLLRYYSVFNVEQCEGIPAEKIPAPVEPQREHTPVQEAEAVVANMPKRPAIEHAGGRACYSPAADKVTMPKPEDFRSGEDYYTVLFHELTHSTGHAIRLNRKGITDSIIFGSPTYAKEELVAEMGAAFLSGHVGIVERTVDNSAAYIQNWLAELSKDRKLVIQAAAQAQKAADFILGKKFEDETETTTTTTEPKAE
jgi:antirestriction protein ArdC